MYRIKIFCQNYTKYTRSCIFGIVLTAVNKSVALHKIRTCLCFRFGQVKIEPVCE